MPDLRFEVRGARASFGAATPAIALNLKIENRMAAEMIQTIVLRCQIQIETPRRRYAEQEQGRLRDLFGEPERWGQTLRPMVWTNITTTIPAFAGAAEIQLAVPCTFDFNVAASKYFYGLQDGTVPITLLFSGTIFYQSPADELQAAPISWNAEARFQFPVEIWKQCMDLHYGNTAWLCLRRDVFDRLYDLKVQQGLATFDEALERMMQAAQQVGV